MMNRVEAVREVLENARRAMSLLDFTAVLKAEVPGVVRVLPGGRVRPYSAPSKSLVEDPGFWPSVTVTFPDDKVFRARDFPTGPLVDRLLAHGFVPAAKFTRRAVLLADVPPEAAIFDMESWWPTLPVPVREDVAVNDYEDFLRAPATDWFRPLDLWFCRFEGDRFDGAVLATGRESIKHGERLVIKCFPSKSSIDPVLSWAFEEAGGARVEVPFEAYYYDVRNLPILDEFREHLRKTWKMPVMRARGRGPRQEALVFMSPSSAPKLETARRLSARDIRPFSFPSGRKDILDRWEAVMRLLDELENESPEGSAVLADRSGRVLWRGPILNMPFADVRVLLDAGPEMLASFRLVAKRLMAALGLTPVAVRYGYKRALMAVLDESDLVPAPPAGLWPDFPSVDKAYENDVRKALKRAAPFYARGSVLMSITPGGEPRGMLRPPAHDLVQSFIGRRLWRPRKPLEMSWTAEGEPEFLAAVASALWEETAPWRKEWKVTVRGCDLDEGSRVFREAGFRTRKSRRTGTLFVYERAAPRQARAEVMA